MDIKGTYKISMEMSARKQVEGLLGTTQRLLRRTGINNVPEPPDKEEHIKKIVEMFKENQAVFDSVTLTFDEDRITLRTSDGEMVYTIKEKTEGDDGQITLKLNSDELGKVTWRGTTVNNFFIFESEDELSEYVFERQ